MNVNGFRRWLKTQMIHSTMTPIAPSIGRTKPFPSSVRRRKSPSSWLYRSRQCATVTTTMLALPAARLDLCECLAMLPNEKSNSTQWNAESKGGGRFARLHGKGCAISSSGGRFNTASPPAWPDQIQAGVDRSIHHAESPRGESPRGEIQGAKRRSSKPLTFDEFLVDPSQ